MSQDFSSLIEVVGQFEQANLAIIDALNDSVVPSIKSTNKSNKVVKAVGAGVAVAGITVAAVAAAPIATPAVVTFGVGSGIVGSGGGLILGAEGAYILSRKFNHRRIFKLLATRDEFKRKIVQELTSAQMTDMVQQLMALAEIDEDVSFWVLIVEMAKQRYDVILDIQRVANDAPQIIVRNAPLFRQLFGTLSRSSQNYVKRILAAFGINLNNQGMLELPEMPRRIEGQSFNDFLPQCRDLLFRVLPFLVGGEEFEFANVAKVVGVGSVGIVLALEVAAQIRSWNRDPQLDQVAAIIEQLYQQIYLLRNLSENLRQTDNSD